MARALRRAGRDDLRARRDELGLHLLATEGMLVFGGRRHDLLRVGRCDSVAQPRQESGFVLDAKNSETTLPANLSALVALCTFAPLAFGVCFRRYAGLTSEISDDAAGNVLAAFREATIESESFEQNGEAEPAGARLGVE